MTPTLQESGEGVDPSYQNLVKAVRIVARHPQFPEKPEIVRLCVGDIVERSIRGRLTPMQRSELLGILLSNGTTC